MVKERVKLVIYFCLGLVIGLIFNFNIAASENIQETKNIAFIGCFIAAFSNSFFLAARFDWLSAKNPKEG